MSARGIQDRQARECCPLESPVTSEEAISLFQGVGADHEVRDESLTGPAGSAVATPRKTGRRGRRLVHPRELDRQSSQGRFGSRGIGKGRDDLCPDDVACDDDALVQARAKR